MIPRVNRFPTLPHEFSDAYRRQLQDIIREHATIIEDAQNGLRWEDLRFPAQGINPAGSTAPPSVNTTDGLLDFSATATKIVGGVAQMPHAWAAEAAPVVKPHLHLLYRGATSGNSVWKFEYQAANVNGDFAGSYTSDTKTHVGPASATKHVLLAFDDVDLSGYRDSCCILWRISRIGGDAADTFGSNVALIEFDIHYQSDGRGSEMEYPT